MIVTPTGTATPTKPAPTAITSPKMFSLEDDCTATPWTEPVLKLEPSPLIVPFEIPPTDPAPDALPVTWEPAPMYACVSFVSDSTETPAPTPTNPPATPPVTPITFVSSRATNETLLPAATVALPIVSA